MNSQTNLHEGHRKRMINKLLAYPQSFSDHELLETVLFYAIPRRDTNALAHRLIKSFGSLSAVLKAKPAELTCFEGVGEHTAALITAMGVALTRNNGEIKNTSLKTFEAVRDYLQKEFEDATNEHCVIVFLDKNYKKIGQLQYGDFNKFRVDVDLNELARFMISINPTYALMGHNHIGEICEPSKADILSTKKIYVLFQTHGVKLLEHVIFHGRENYSFRKNGLFELISNEADVQALFNLGGQINDKG